MPLASSELEPPTYEMNESAPVGVSFATYMSVPSLRAGTGPRYVAPVRPLLALESVE